MNNFNANAMQSFYMKHKPESAGFLRAQSEETSTKSNDYDIGCNTETGLSPPQHDTHNKNVSEASKALRQDFTVDEMGQSTNFPGDPQAQKRKKELDVDEGVEAKKTSNFATDEKKGAYLRKNIRDVMDENQLDTNTLAAQREESERLARVAEQQKLIRENQRQAVVNRNIVRTQNRVLSLLQSSSTFAKVTSAESSFDPRSEEKSGEVAIIVAEKSEETHSVRLANEGESISSMNSSEADAAAGNDDVNDIVTIDDSSSEDDCILLSDDEEELEEEPEDDPNNSGLHVKDAYNVPDEHGRVIVNIGHPDGEEDIFIAPQIARTIKPHQIGGVRFLFDNIIESIKRFRSSSGFGCILSHSMGLGKTLQVICFCDIFLRHTPSKTVLCVMPINTLQNWVSEFNMWLPRFSQNPDYVRPRQFDIFVLNDQQKTLSARAKVILKWAEEGGVLLIGYELFRLLALKLLPTRKRRGNKIVSPDKHGTESNKRLLESIHQALVKPGPDLVICDEGHRIKNAHAGISLALKQIRTRRRIVLTGYPLQNNLLEYWCMVDFVRPNYLGMRTEFCNMFERPIQNGQCIDSTPEDIKLMRYRAHVLHSLLLGFVQRRSHVVLQQTLPRKLEYVILTRMTSFQRQLYDTFMNDIVRTKSVPNPLKAFAVCCKIWNHPDVLYNFLKKKEMDLDLDIDEGEIVVENMQSQSTANATEEDLQQIKTPTKNVSSNSDKLKASYHNTEDSKTFPISINVNQQPQQQQNSMIISAKQPNPTYDGLMKSSYYGVNYSQHNPSADYSNHCSNNYWQEQNVTYFPYQSVSDNIESSSKPNYVGIMLPQRNEDLKPKSDNPIGSSEIVDLDTKEIKTIETDIDMSQNPVIKGISVKTSNEDLNQDNKQPAVDGKTTADASSDLYKISSKGKTEDTTMHEWAVELMKRYKPGIIESSPKMEVLFCILNESVKMGDRVLLFSQSLLTLNLIETFLQANRLPDSNTYWARGVSYFRLDGSTTSQEREKLVNEFNFNDKIKLFLISTRAGSLGINLVGANRVIVFDASWNPCHDTQAVYRIYRYGQIKPCYVYRIVMDKCLEKKIYDRQIKKQGMADRVVDECNPDAHLSIRDITNLCHDYDDSDKTQNDTEKFSQPIESYEDTIVQKILESHKSILSKEPFYHESLLIDRKEKKLSQAEKRQAHRGYEMEKKACVKQGFTTSNKIQYRIVRNDGTVVTRPVASIRPMQTTKTALASKTGGIRTTRWIPAEVWQRQGMTAQEMTLPLDVVIPTHSNDKSNIILKSGQRVMVLKSAKGIYMQLESGKIIAIRTSSKVNEGAKPEKDEVIDITSENDNPTDKVGSKSQADSKCNAENINGSQTTKVNDNSAKNQESCEINSIKNPTDSDSPRSKDLSQKKSTSPIQQQQQKKDNTETVNAFNESNYNTLSTKARSPASQIDITSQEASKKNFAVNQETSQDDVQESSPLNKDGIQLPHQIQSMDSRDSIYSLKHSIKNQVQCSNESSKSNIQKLSKNLPHPTQQTSFQSPDNYSYPCAPQLSGETKHPKHKGEVKLPLNSFSNYNCSPSNNVRKTPKEMSARVPSVQQHPQNHQMKHLNMANHPAPYSQYSMFNQQQQQPKIHSLYSSNFSMENSQYENLSSSSSHIQPHGHSQEQNGSYNSAPEDSSNLHSSNNVPNSCEYPPHFPDYAYGNPYEHSNYFNPFHSNTYGNGPPATITSNPYHMPWSPLVAQTSIHDQCNPIHSSAYNQNSAQYNQWHHKL